MACRAFAALDWAEEMFGPIAKDRRERGLRFIEEALELAQTEGVDLTTLAAVAARVYGKPPGDQFREIGQAQMCLEVLAANAGISATYAARVEFERVRGIPKEEWKRRHDAKVAIGIASNSP